MSSILNSKGEPIVLNEKELRLAQYAERQLNALGYEVATTTLTTIMKQISEQKFYEIAPAEYVPVRVGNGAWSTNLVTYRSFDISGSFFEGDLNTGSSNTRLASADSGVDSVVKIVKNWAKSIGWTIMDLEQASKSGNWDLVSSKEKARKTNWDLGIQQVAFLGSPTDSSVQGLLTQSSANINTTVITQSIATMAQTPTILNTFLETVLNAYRSNCNRTAYPTHFIIPESDYLGLAAASSPSFPLKTTLELVETMFKTMTRNQNFKVLPCAYGDSAQSGLGVQRYALLNYSESSIVMDIPVDYTNTMANSFDSFSFQNVGYGQYTGVQSIRSLELLYFQY